MNKNSKSQNKLIRNLQQQLQAKRDSYTQMSYEYAIQKTANEIYPLNVNDLFDYSRLFPVYLFNAR